MILEAIRNYQNKKKVQSNKEKLQLFVDSYKQYPIEKYSAKIPSRLSTRSEIDGRISPSYQGVRRTVLIDLLQDGEHPDRWVPSLRNNLRYLYEDMGFTGNLSRWENGQFVAGDSPIHWDSDEPEKMIKDLMAGYLWKEDDLYKEVEHCLEGLKKAKESIRRGEALKAEKDRLEQASSALANRP